MKEQAPKIVTRRNFLRGLAGTAGLAALAPLATACTSDTPKSGSLKVEVKPIEVSWDFTPKTPVTGPITTTVPVTTTLPAGAVPKPAAAAAVPTAVETSKRVVVDVIMKPGDRYVTPDEAVVVGDVAVSHPDTGEVRRFFDDNEHSGMAVKVHKGAIIEAPYGANVHVTGPDEKVKEQVIGQAIQDMEAKGCDFAKSGKGCAWVYVTTSRGTPQSQVPFGTK